MNQKCFKNIILKKNNLQALHRIKKAVEDATNISNTKRKKMLMGSALICSSHKTSENSNSVHFFVSDPPDVTFPLWKRNYFQPTCGPLMEIPQNCVSSDSVSNRSMKSKITNLLSQQCIDRWVWCDFYPSDSPLQ